MFTQVTCNNCGIGKGINYIFTITEWEKYCRSCGSHPSHEKTFDFCSLRCSRLYINKLEKHKCDDHYICKGVDAGKIKRVFAMCGVCHKDAWIPYRKGMNIKGMERYEDFIK